MRDCTKHANASTEVIEGKAGEDSGFETMSEENLSDGNEDEEMKE